MLALQPVHLGKQCSHTQDTLSLCQASPARKTRSHTSDNYASPSFNIPLVQGHQFSLLAHAALDFCILVDFPPLASLRGMNGNRYMPDTPSVTRTDCAHLLRDDIFTFNFDSATRGNRRPLRGHARISDT